MAFYMLQSFYSWLGYCPTNDYICGFTKGNFHTPESVLKFTNEIPLLPPYLSQLIFVGFTAFYVKKFVSLQDVMNYLKIYLITQGHNPIHITILLTGVEAFLAYLIKRFKEGNEQPPTPTSAPTPTPTTPSMPPKRDRKEIEAEREKNKQTLEKNRRDIQKLKPPKSRAVLHAFETAQVTSLNADQTRQTASIVPVNTERPDFQAN